MIACVLWIAADFFYLAFCEGASSTVVFQSGDKGDKGVGVVYGIILVSTVWELRTDHTLQLFGRVISNASVEYAVGTDRCSKSLVFLEV